MMSINDLSQDMVEEILFRVPMTSLGAIRSTCKLWNDVSKDPSFKLCVKAAAKDIRLITIRDFKPCLISVNLHKHGDLVVPFIEQIGKFKQDYIRIRNVFHCNSLLLCDAYEDKEWRLVVWNPYTGQTRWIQYSRNIYGTSSSSLYGMGYDSNNHHKILRITSYLRHSFGYEIYDFKTKSWRVLDVSIINWHRFSGQSVSLKGNNYFIAQPGKVGELFRNRLLCFDFTKERFLSVPLPPCSSRSRDSVILSVVREEKLAVLSRRLNALEMEIWITNKIDEPNVVSWSCFLRVGKLPIDRIQYLNGSFFVDEKKKVAVIFYVDDTKTSNYKACMLGEGGHYREVVDLVNICIDGPFLRSSSYIPSWVQIH